MSNKLTLLITLLLTFSLGFAAAYLFLTNTQDTTTYYNYYLHLSQTKNQQLSQNTYTLTYAKGSSESYLLSPVGPGDTIYVESSTVPLDSYLDKKIKITGHWVLTTKQLKHANAAPDTFPNLVGAVAIESLQPVK